MAASGSHPPPPRVAALGPLTTGQQLHGAIPRFAPVMGTPGLPSSTAASGLASANGGAEGNGNGASVSIAVEDGMASVYDIIQAVQNCSRKRAHCNFGSYVSTDSQLRFDTHIFRPSTLRQRPKRQPVVTSWAQVVTLLCKMKKKRKEVALFLSSPEASRLKAALPAGGEVSPEHQRTIDNLEKLFVEADNSDEPVQAGTTATCCTIEGLEDQCRGILSLVQQHPALLPHASAALQSLHGHLERLVVSGEVFFTATVPVVEGNDDLGFTLKRLCPFMDEPLLEDRRQKERTNLEFWA